MTTPHRQSRCDTVLALIDECLADYERSTGTRPNRPRPDRTETTPC